MRLSGDKMLLKNTLKKIKKSIGRYLSLLVIILIGVAFYAGVKEAVPNIRDIQSDYYNETNLMDIKLVSTYGLTDEDVLRLKEINLVDDVLGSYSKYVLDGEDVIQVHSIEEEINTFHFVDGRMPKANNECLADSSYYKVGDKIKVVEANNESNLLVDEFTVVGTIMSPLYTSNDHGSAPIGDGKLKSYIFVQKEVFNYDFYTEIYMAFDKSIDDTPYSESYKAKVLELTNEIELIKGEREEARKQEIISSLSNANTSSNLIDDFNVEWHILNREEVVSSYKVMENQYEEIEIIADIIPIFFILVVALMTSNTMARMIVEERGEMGTLSSLGFSNFKIIFNYLIYVLSSTVLGVVLGYFIGTLTIPNLVYDCFPITMPEMIYKADIFMFIIILVVSCLVMSLVTIYACQKELREKPAYLLRPVSPKSGKVIFLERINFIWDRLSFSWKITMRNISRYKKRVIMTLVGTAGCTFLILIGFAIKDSVNGIGDKQYNELFKYDNLVILNKEFKENEDLTENLSNLLTNGVMLNQSSYKVVNEDERYLDFYLIVPKEENNFFKKYFILRDSETKENLELNDNGAIITSRIADLYKVEVGDEITLEDLDKNTFKVTVSGITENYVSNYVYMTKDYYKDTFEKEITYNAVVSSNSLDKKELANSLLNLNEVISVNFATDLLEQANNGISGLNNIVILLVVISSLLAFAVLYNLTSINISERTREIATLKVLGFKDSETNEYIYRETLITVIVGIILGLLITPVLHGYIIDLLEADNMMFLREIKIESYMYAALLTFTFAIIMQIITYFKLKKVDMIESLKSVE